jgi:hypothetical protein
VRHSCCFNGAAAVATVVAAAAATACLPSPQGMGVLDKVVLVFKPEDVFWGKNVDFVIMATDDLSGRW